MEGSTKYTIAVLVTMSIAIRAVTIWQIAYCVLHARCSQCIAVLHTDVVIIKPVTGRASICSASLKTTRRLIALGFHTEKGLSMFTFQ